MEMDISYVTGDVEMLCANFRKFNDELVKEKEEGGMRAARMLNDAVERYLREANIYVSRILVRIYVDMTGLSKSLGKSKLTGLEKRSLGDFAAGFTRAMPLFDFVDALDEEGAKLKVRGTIFPVMPACLS
jgi:carbon monoxide dehydrogenase subunit G